MPAYVMFGFDTAGSLAEETNDPRRRGPRAILMALGAAGVAGMLLLLFALMSAKDLHNEALTSNGLPFLVKSVLGTTLGDILLWDVVLSIAVCCLAIHTAAIRMMFSMARDNALPGSNYIAKVSEKSRTPVVPAVIVGILAMIILLVNINQPKIFTVITGIAIVMIYLAYLCVTVPLLRRRTSGWEGVAQAQGLFSMRGAGATVNALAVAYGALMAINIGWPRNEIYGAGNYMWGGLIFIVGVIAIGGIWFAAVGQQRMGVLDSHAVAGDEIETAARTGAGVRRAPDDDGAEGAAARSRPRRLSAAGGERSLELGEVARGRLARTAERDVLAHERVHAAGARCRGRRRARRRSTACAAQTSSTAATYVASPLISSSRRAASVVGMTRSSIPSAVLEVESSSVVGCARSLASAAAAFAP